MLWDSVRWDFVLWDSVPDSFAALFLSSHVEGTGAEWNYDIILYCCKLLVIQSSSTVHSLLVSSFQMYSIIFL